MKNFIENQMALRATAWEAAKKILDVASAEKRDLSAEENQSYEKISKELEDRQATIEKLRADEAREVRLDAATREFADQVRPVADAPKAVRGDKDVLRAMARGEVRSFNFAPTEERVVVKTSTGSPVPTSFYDQVIMKARFVGPMLTTSMMLNTTSGENLQIPSLDTYSTSALTGEGTAPSTSDPAFNAFVTLGAYKYAFLTSVSVELLSDSGVDILGFLSDVVGNSIGTAANTALTTGGGTTEPNGIVNRSSVAATATALAITADKLIDLVYSVDTAGRRLPGTGFQMNATQIGKVRQLKDGNGQYIFSPSLSAEQNDILLGYPIFENPAMANAASATRPVIFGNLSSYYVRQAGGIQLDRSDDFAFNTGLVTFRATIRIDGNLIQTSHVKHLLMPNS